MKILTVLGLSGRGKTTVVESLIKELKKRNYTVGTVKEIHYEKFQMDTEGKNTFRHRQAGGETVVARAQNETDILYKGKLDIYKILDHFQEDIVIMEGVRDAVAPEIVVCKEDETPVISPLTIAVSGKYVNNNQKEFEGVAVVNCINDIKRLADIVEEKVPHMFFDFDKECCGLCGYSCKGLLSEVLKGNKKAKDCVLKKDGVSLKVAGKEVAMVPFVQKILKNTVMGVVKELKGYAKNAKIEIEINENN